MKKSAWKILFILATLFTLTSCKGKKSDQIDLSNLSQIEAIETIFKTNIKEETKNLSTIAEIITTKVFPEYSIIIQQMEAGYFPGFDTEIKDFTQAVSFSPMIGSIPLIGYIFESNNPKLLSNTLMENYNTRWNICTEAGIVGSYIEENYVIFVMLPDEDF